MSKRRMSDQDIQGLKAQEAKDLAIRLLGELAAKETGTISPGEVQLRELEFELKLKEAQSADQRESEAHQERVRELERQIEQEKTRQAEANGHVQDVYEEYRNLVAQVSDSSESLSLQLERTTRKHNLKIEELGRQFDSRSNNLKLEIEALQSRRAELSDEIQTLAEIRDEAADLDSLKTQIESQRITGEQEIHQLEEEFSRLQFEATKKINEVKRQQELAIAELEAQHQKDKIAMNRAAADSILGELGMVACHQQEWDRQQQQLQEQQTIHGQQRDEIRAAAKEEFCRTYNITMAEPFDVTELFYREQTVQSEVTSLRTQVEKLDAEIVRMRHHVEQEPQRIAAAVEAAKAQVQNYIEQSPKR